MWAKLVLRDTPLRCPVTFLVFFMSCHMAPSKPIPDLTWCDSSLSSSPATLHVQYPLRLDEKGNAAARLRYTLAWTKFGCGRHQSLLNLHRGNMADIHASPATQCSLALVALQSVRFTSQRTVAWNGDCRTKTFGEDPQRRATACLCRCCRIWRSAEGCQCTLMTGEGRPLGDTCC